MGKIVVFENLTLDGVMQAPGRPDEDRRGGFQNGGWATPYADPVSAEVAGEGMSGTGGLLLGRRTYEEFSAVWPEQTDSPFADWLNSARKYVASTTLEEPLAWRNSTLLKGDVAEAIAELKAESDTDFVVLGSGELVRTLMKHALVDQYVLQIHPLILGSGRRLFTDGVGFTALRLVESRTSTTGVVIAIYEPESRG